MLENIKIDEKQHIDSYNIIDNSKVIKKYSYITKNFAMQKLLLLEEKNSVLFKQMWTFMQININEIFFSVKTFCLMKICFEEISLSLYGTLNVPNKNLEH